MRLSKAVIADLAAAFDWHMNGPTIVTNSAAAKSWRVRQPGGNWIVSGASPQPAEAIRSYQSGSAPAGSCRRNSSPPNVTGIALCGFAIARAGISALNAYPRLFRGTVRATRRQHLSLRPENVSSDPCERQRHFGPPAVSDFPARCAMRLRPRGFADAIRLGRGSSRRLPRCRRRPPRSVAASLLAQSDTMEYAAKEHQFIVTVGPAVGNGFRHGHG